MVRGVSSRRVTSPHDTIAQAVSHGLDRLSRESGGLMFPKAGHQAPEVFSKIESDLRNMYVLGFIPAGALDGKFHALKVTMVDQDFVVRSRAGYRARGRDISGVTGLP